MVDPNLRVPASRASALGSWFSQRLLARSFLLALLLLAFALRLYRLGFQELRGDEAFGYFFSLRPFSDIVRATLALQEPHPVASYFLQHVWLGWAGESEFALRFISAWFGVLAVALLYRLARRLALSPVTALLATGLLTLSPYAIWHSQDARMYSISLALTLASTWLALEALRRGRWPLWGAYLGVSWLALHTHYFAVFVILAQNLFVFSRALVTSRLRSAAVQWLRYQIVLGMLYLPWLLVAGPTLTGYSGNGNSPGFVAMVRRSLSVFAVGESIPADWRTYYAAVAVLLLLLGAIQLLRSGTAGRRALWLLLLYLAVPVLATWLSALRRPIYDERYLIAAVPPFYLLLAAAIGTSVRRAALASTSERYALLTAGLFAFVLFLGMAASLANHYTDPAYSKTRGWRGLAQILERYRAGLPPQKVRIAQNFPDPTLWYYYRGPVQHIVLPPQAHDAPGAQAEVAGLVEAGVQRVLLPVQPADWWDGTGIAPAVLAQHYTRIAEKRVGVWPLQVYARPPQTLMPVSVRFANGLVLAEAAIQPAEIVPGGVLAVSLRWAGTRDQLAGQEKLFLHLLDQQGQIVAQTDRPLAGSGMPGSIASYGILLAADLPDGPYRLIAGLYDPTQDDAPRLLTEVGADFVELGVIRRAP